MEKTVEQCKIKLNLKESRLVFQLHCRHGVYRFFLLIHENEPYHVNPLLADNIFDRSKMKDFADDKIIMTQKILNFVFGTVENNIFKSFFSKGG